MARHCGEIVNLVTLQQVFTVFSNKFPSSVGPIVSTCDAASQVSFIVGDVMWSSDCSELKSDTHILPLGGCWYPNSPRRQICVGDIGGLKTQTKKTLQQIPVDVRLSSCRQPNPRAVRP